MCNSLGIAGFVLASPSLAALMMVGDIKDLPAALLFGDKFASPAMQYAACSDVRRPRLCTVMMRSDIRQIC